jgi:glutamine amidotransferase
MCRWFAYISASEECLLEDVLITPNHSLCKQVNANFLPGLESYNSDPVQGQLELATRNRYLNVDGIGVAWYTPTRAAYTPLEGPRPTLYKSAQPPLNDLNFRSIAQHTASRCLFAHIRAATSTPVVTVNNHPFAFGRHIIMHNGSISAFEQIARGVSEKMHHDAHAAMGGRTDSEHFAALYMTHLAKHTKKPGGGHGASAWEEGYTAPEMKAALIATLEDVFTLQQKLLPELPGNSLNVAVTDGDSMVAMRVRNHVSEEPPSLYYSTEAGVSLNSKYPGSAYGDDNPDWAPDADWTKNPEDYPPHVIVASEPSTRVAEAPKVEDTGPWKLIGKNTCVLVERGVPWVEEMNYDAKFLSTKKTVFAEEPGKFDGRCDKCGSRTFT